MSSGDGAEGSEADRALRRRIGEREDLELQSLARLASLAAEDRGDDGEAAQIEAQRRLAQADEAFARFDYAGATTQLDEALQLLRPLARRATGRQRLAAVHLQRAMVLHVWGEREAALEELRTCIHLDPRCAPDPARHPPELLALHATAREAGERADAVLRVTTEPPGARVTLDGRRGTRTPAAWDEVDAGRHYVTIERDGFLPEVHAVNVAAGEPTERSFPLTAGPAPMRASAALRALQDEGPEADTRWRAEATSLSEADVLLVLHRTPDALRLAAFDPRGAALAAALEREDADRDALLGYLDETLPPPTVPFYGQWWFWTPLAAGISIALAAATFVVVNTPDVRLVGGSVSREF
ncbi:MAG TPA: PEGA domain-containing protein [Sandaracinaceae bacterium LLY-WYZ-13_1]|nr:PEGA domain-containing protein [Sandaracinaceae bacterium LLY-WYZ-13_1]